MPTITATAAVNEAIAAAKSLPELIAIAPPELATQLETKPLLYSKSPPAVALALILSWASTKYALGWDANTCALISGLVAMAAAYAMRAITSKPIAGIVSSPATAN